MRQSTPDRTVLPPRRARRFRAGTGETGGTPCTHPNYDPRAFFLYDLGVVVVKKPVQKDGYGALPEPNILDKPAKNTGFTGDFMHHTRTGHRDIARHNAATGWAARRRDPAARRVVMVLLSAFMAVWAPAALAQPAPPAATITFLHFNDIYEIGPVEGGRAGGLARFAAIRARLKRTHPELLTTLGGDYLSPSALGTARVNGERLAGRQMVAVLNTVGVDWVTFGNHEFDVGEQAFRARLAEAKFHIVSSNVADPNGNPFPGTVARTIVPVRVAGRVVRIGLIGLTVVDPNPVRWAQFKPPLEAAKQAVEALRGRCDAIVALTHLTLAGDQQLVEQVPEIDLVLGGHEHENWLLWRGARFVPIVKADANVRSVAIVALRFARPGERPTVTARLETITSRTKEDPRTAAEVRKWTELGFAGFRQEGFEPAQAVATSTARLDGREAAVRNGPTRLTAIVLDAMRHEAGTDIAVFNSGSIRIDDVLPPGPVTQYDVIRILPFGGNVVKAAVSGALLARMLDMGVKNRGTGGFLQWAGITGGEDGFRVGGQPIDPAARYPIAITDFLLTGREANLAFLTRDSADVANVIELRDVRMALIDELKRQSSPTDPP